MGRDGAMETVMRRVYSTLRRIADRRLVGPEHSGTGRHSNSAWTFSITTAVTCRVGAVAVHRLRQRYGELVRSEVGRTVGSEEEIDAEMRHLRETLAEMSY